MKLGLIIPFRDREEQLRNILPIIKKNLNDNNIDYIIAIVNQNDEKPFNKGYLINVGVNLLFNKVDYFIFHDVDLIPLTDIYKIKDFSGNLVKKIIGRNDFDKSYFGGVTFFKKEDFIKINGFSNNYLGWGCEDVDLLYRCYYSKLKIKKYNGIWKSIDKEKTSKEYEELYKSESYKKNFEILKSMVNKEINYLNDGYYSINYYITDIKKISNKIYYFNISLITL